MAAPAAIVAGFYGKLPARGDFVCLALPGDFTQPWDRWLQTVISGSRVRMGQEWLPAFLESPVWRFALPAGLCGARSVLGLMLPSVDRAGRYFPLTFAALVPLGADDMNQSAAEAWLDRCEAAGRAALEQDAGPEQLGAMLDTPNLSAPATKLSQTVWWTEGAPRVPATRFTREGMPDAAIYATMLDARQPGSNATDNGASVAWESPS